MNELPHGWAEATVGEVVAEARPGFPSGRHNVTGIGVPHLRPMNVGRDGQVDLSVVKFVENADGARLRRGDVLFNNTNSPDLVGKTAYFDRDGDWAYSNHMTRLTPGDAIEGRFLAMQLHWLWMTGYYASVMNNHVNQASVATKTLLSRVRLLIPPLAEQRRVVAAIEEQLSRLDAAEREIRSAKARLHMFVRTAKRLATRPSAKWETLSFAEAFQAVSDGGRKIKQRDYVSVGRYPVIDQGERPIGGYTNDESTLYQGSLPVILFGDHTRRFKLVREPFAVGADGVRVLLPRSGWVPEFALAQLESTQLPNRGYARHYQFLRAAQFFRPSIEVQEERLRGLRMELAQAEQLANSLRIAVAKSLSLRGSILATAFGGELVPQDPDDQPASVLLERVAAECAAQPKPARTLKTRGTT